MGPRAVRLAASWADGLTGFTWSADATEVAPIFELARKSWAEQGRKEPKLKTAFWVAVGPGARDQLATHLGRYLNWVPAEEREQSQKGAGFAGSAAELRDLLRQIEDLGADEVNLVSTCGDPDEVDRLAEAVG
jgi:alkanesulfonate monooxygenase SsuD/methylene tetrahydromethanopterin reductase-like flavin-dependent oxidoreductase (luciferase family)